MMELSPEVIINGLPWQIFAYGYCRCGCGKKTTVEKTASHRRGIKKGEPNKYRCGHSTGKEELNLNWKGGRKVRKKGGYVRIKVNDHPRADVDGYVLEHILIAEKALGKLLPAGAPVHHHTPEQLVICQDHAYHMLLHRRARALKECGHASWRKCRFCKEYDSPEKLVVTYNYVHHQQCDKEYRKNKRGAND